MKYGNIGTATSATEVTDVSAFGVWLLHQGKEYFLGYEDFPWFLHAPIRKILAVVDEGPGHLRWPDLDIDLHVDALRDPGAFPLVYEPEASYGAESPGKAAP